MDRNLLTSGDVAAPSVALRKESVDRNTENAVLFLLTSGSLSARRAWIEMEDDGILSTGAPVALRKESVDRNRVYAILSAIRRVALRKESVDRNWQDIDDREKILASLSARRAWIEMPCRTRRPNIPSGRSPQGERG